MRNRKAATIVISAVLALAAAQIAYAGPNTWYWGHIRLLKLAGDERGSFFVHFEDDDTLDHCKYDRVYFLTGRLGNGRVEMAYTMAMSAMMAGREFGLVSKKVDVHEDGEFCYATGQTAGLRPK